jgi:DNA primase
MSRVAAQAGAQGGGAASSGFLPPAFLDEVRARTTLSDLVSAQVKLAKAGREFKGCCPFHNEKTPSFTVNDEKGFAHCFGCGAHVDAIGWLVRVKGLPFMDAVRELAEGAGLALPERSPDAVARAQRIAGLRPTVEAAAAIFAGALAAPGGAAARRWLAARGVDEAVQARFGLGWAPADGGLSGKGFVRGDLMSAGLVGRSEKGFHYPRFKSRVIIPIHDERGRVCGFGGRVLETADGVAKYVNSPESEIFDKGGLLFNLHRAREAVHGAGRVIAVEGYMDVIALDGAGLAEVVAPMGTAMTDRQLERLWRLHHAPILMFDGDGAGQKAALRAAELAMPGLGPGRALQFVLIADGADPDDLVQRGGRDGVEAALAQAVPLHLYVFDALAAGLGAESAPEAVAALWARLEALARSIGHEATRAQYLGQWRARYEREWGAAARLGVPAPLHALTRAEDGDYAFPEAENDSEAQLIRILRGKLELRERRRDLAQRGRDMDAMAKLMGFNTKAINRVVADIEADPDAREAGEALWVLYRRVAGVVGPMTQALMPSVIDARPARVAGAAQRQLRAADALFAGRE